MLVHQENLGLEEKILRHFDLSSQYGVRCPFFLDVSTGDILGLEATTANVDQPCIGIARLKRWRRANMLKLNPPIEVLAVLLKDKTVEERAHMDRLLS